MEMRQAAAMAVRQILATESQRREALEKMVKAMGAEVHTGLKREPMMKVTSPCSPEQASWYAAADARMTALEDFVVDQFDRTHQILAQVVESLWPLPGSGVPTDGGAEAVLKGQADGGFKPTRNLGGKRGRGGRKGKA